MNSHRNPRNQQAVGGDAGNPGGQQLLSGPRYAVALCHPKGGAS
jgi:hypothetical protein